MPSDLGISRPNAADEGARQDALVAAARRPEREYLAMGVEELKNMIHHLDWRIEDLIKEKLKLKAELKRMTKEPCP